MKPFLPQRKQHFWSLTITDIQNLQTCPESLEIELSEINDKYFHGIRLMDAFCHCSFPLQVVYVF